MLNNPRRHTSISVHANLEILNKVLEDLCKYFHRIKHIVDEIAGLEPWT
jgi:hypothetical protein